jgi:Glycosyl hydrolases family 18
LSFLDLLQSIWLLVRSLTFSVTRIIHQTLLVLTKDILFSGSTADYCGPGCQTGYGACNGPSITDSFRKALANAQYDGANGGEWYWDANATLFWTWDTPDIIARKFAQIVQPKGLGGVMAWSLAQDSRDWSHLLAIGAGLKNLTAAITSGSSGTDDNNTSATAPLSSAPGASPPVVVGGNNSAEATGTFQCTCTCAGAITSTTTTNTI